MPKKLFEEDSEDEEVTLKTENEYAKKYDTWRQKEELHKLEQKYGSKALTSDASGSDSEDDSEPQEMSEEMETQFLKTLALLKTKDQRIYDPNYKFFEDSKVEEKLDDKPEKKMLTFADSDDDDDDDDGENIFSIEKKAERPEEKRETKDKIPKEVKLKNYLTGKVEHIDKEAERDLAPLKALWSDPSLNEGEAFLRDYILNKRYLDDGDAGDALEKIRDDAELEADEQLVEEQGKFERAYNFRFEEPDEEYLKRYPRTMNFIRPKDDRRSRKRAELRQRKEQDKLRKMEEIARLKALKLKEIQDKIAKIKEVTGNEELAFNEEDLEGDFDPEKHDRQMRALFDEQYYGEADEHKPKFPELDQELEIENWDSYDPDHTGDRNDEEPHCEDENFNMDADYDPKQSKQNLIDEIKKTLGKKRRNRKKKNKLAELLLEEKPKFVPSVTNKSYAEYMEEYYKMDCEDVIGDLPTRFKYREVVPNDYGLTIEEILLADDKELTQWVPLKKVVKHRPEVAERGEVAAYRQKAADAKLKKKVLPSLFAQLPQEPEIVVPLEEAKKKKKKKKKNKDKAEVDNNEVVSDMNQVINERHRSEATEDISTQNGVNHVSEISSGDRIITKDKKKRNEKNTVHETNPENQKSIHQDTKTNDIGVDQEKFNKKKKHKKENTLTSDEIQYTIEAVPDTASSSNNNEEKTLGSKDMPAQNGNTSQTVTKNRRKKKNKDGAQKNIKKNLKRKLSSNENIPYKKKKTNANSNNNKEKNSKDSSNPLGKLSDERLKAYGLNPKKYRSFLKYKKF